MPGSRPGVFSKRRYSFLNGEPLRARLSDKRTGKPMRLAYRTPRSSGHISRFSLVTLFPLAARGEARAAPFGLLDHRVERYQNRLALDLRGRRGKPAGRCDHDGLARR